MPITENLILLGLIYSLVISVRAYRESGEKWMLFSPLWIRANSGVSENIRWQGVFAFAILFAGLLLYLVSSL